MSYAVLITLHLFMAVTFIGVVFFEVLFLESIRKKLPASTMQILQTAITTRARKFMPFVIALLFISGIGMLHSRISDVAQLTETPFGILLSIKVLLAISVLGHFITAMYLSKTQKMTCSRFKFIHLSVFLHMLAIIFLAKNMFYIHW